MTSALVDRRNELVARICEHADDKRAYPWPAVRDAIEALILEAQRGPTLDERLSVAQRLLRDGHHDDFSSAVAEARDRITALEQASDRLERTVNDLTRRLAGWRAGSP